MASRTDPPRPRDAASAAWKWYLAFGLASAVVYYATPPAASRLAVWPLIGWSSVIAIVAGARRDHARVNAWWLLAAGVAMFIAGDNLYSFRNYVRHDTDLFPSYVDVVYLSMYPLLIAGLAALVRRRSDGRDRMSLIDAAVISSGLGIVVWVLVIAPSFHSAGLGTIARLVSMAYPIGDVALLAIAVRLAVGSGRRPPAFWLLTGSLVPLIVADTLYGYLNLAGAWHEHHPVDVGWIAFYVGWGVAALHPSMGQLAERPASTPPLRPRRVLLLGAAVLIAPAVLFTEQATGQVQNAAAIAVVSAVTFALVLVRTAGLAAQVADQRGEARFRALIDNASDAIVVLDDTGCVRYLTPSTERLLGRPVDQLMRRPLAELLERRDAVQLEAVLAGATSAAALEWQLSRGADGWRDVEVRTADLRAVRGVNGVVLTIRDITERKQLDAELRRQALHDALTGLPNRTLFLDRVGHALARVLRHDGQMAVLFLDVDDFKSVNDSLGHSAGDELLIATAARLAGTIRPEDTIARLGGDEFAILVEAGSIDDAVRVADRVHETLQEPIDVGDQQLAVRVSVGIAVGSSDTIDPEDLLRDADAAMYVAKRNGKDRNAIFEPSMHEDAIRRLDTARELRSAIEHDEIVPFYQPIVDVRTGWPMGFEALARWRHPRRGIVGPAEFIPIAEDSGEVVQIGRRMLAAACAQLEQWKRLAVVGEDVYVSVNLSARHVQSEAVVDDVQRVLRTTGLDPASLVLEVTETAVIEDLEATRSNLVALKELGVRLAIDDFGTGYNSLTHLGSLPFDIVKIDKSFVDRLGATSDGEAMVRAVVDLAARLGLVTVAEGVEAPAQASVLELTGCMLGQGYLFAKPAPPEDTRLQVIGLANFARLRDEVAAGALA
jgi:diguanylate cyclase (GGDEF)-like protein/PAS domain S-box-containing protein